MTTPSKNSSSWEICWTDLDPKTVFIWLGQNNWNESFLFAFNSKIQQMLLHIRHDLCLHAVELWSR